MKNLIIFFLSFFLGVQLSSCKEDSADGRVLSAEEITYFKDYISPKYKWGYIDRQGKEKIAAIYDDVRDFSQGRAVVNEGGYWGVIDTLGTEIVRPAFRSMYGYSEGYALAQNFNGVFELLNLDGDKVLTLPYEEVGSVRNGRLRIKDKLGFNYIDLSGKLIGDAYYDTATDFAGNYAVISEAEKYGAIDKNGSEVLPIAFNKIKIIGDQFAAGRRESLWEIFNLKKEIKEYDDFVSFITGKYDQIAVKNKAGEWILLNLIKGTRITLANPYLYPGGEGKWFFREGKKWGILDSLGKEIVPARYDALYQFREGRCAFNLGDYWGYLDANGDQITPPLFPLAWDFRNGRARIIANGGIGFINLEGKMTIFPRFIEVRDFFGGLARFQKIR